MAFCFNRAKEGQFEFIPGVLLFLHNANHIDDWLIEAAKNVLPKLHPIYCQILRTADPSRAAKGTRTNLTPLVKQNVAALCALGSILEHVINYCDVDTEHVVKHLKNFVFSSTAVLLASDIRSPKEMVCTNPCMYTMDDTVRKASWALSNILLTLPRLVPVAEPIIMKRIDSLFKLLQDPYELTVQRSAIVVLKALHEHGTGNAFHSGASTRYLIEEKIKSVFSGCLQGHTAFQNMKLSDDMFGDVNEILDQFFTETDLNDRGVTTSECSVQVKSRGEKTRRRVAFRAASVDWNLNGMMVRYEDDSTIHWPFFAVQKFEWRRKNQDLWMKFQGWQNRKATDVVVRFKGKSFDSLWKNTIEHRIHHVMLRIESDPGSCSDGNAPNSEDSDVVEVQNIKTMVKKWSSIPRGSSESDDGNLQREECDKESSLHNVEMQRSGHWKTTKEHQNAGEAPTGTVDDANDSNEKGAARHVRQLEGECVKAEWTETVVCDPLLFDEDVAAKEFYMKKDLRGAKHVERQYASLKNWDISGPNKDVAGSDTNLSDAVELEGFGSNDEEIEKLGENQKRKNRVQFATDLDEIEVIAISDQESIELIDPEHVKDGDERRDIKEEDVVENVATDEMEVESLSHRGIRPKTKLVNSGKQNRSKNRMRRNVQVTERNAQVCGDNECDKVFGEARLDKVITEDGFEGSSEDKDLSDDDYIPGSAELAIGGNFEKPRRTATRTRRQARERTRSPNEEKHGTDGQEKMGQRRTARPSERGHGGRDRNSKEIRKSFTEFEDFFCGNTEVQVGNEITKSDESNSYLVDSRDVFRNDHLNKLIVVNQRKDDATTKGDDGIGVREGYVCDVDRATEVPGEGDRERNDGNDGNGGNDGSSGRGDENSNDRGSIEELGALKETIAGNGRKETGEEVRHDNNSDKGVCGTAAIINYGVVQDQFGLLVGNLNEVSWITFRPREGR